MTATTMHFGPEWMRAKQPPARPAPSPPLATTPAAAGASSYSALVAPTAPPAPEKHDVARPFRYSKEEMLRIYKEGGGRGGLGLEVERWEGIVREVGYDPVGLKEMGEGEKKMFAGPLNSEIRRRQSNDYLSPLSTSTLGDRSKLGHAHSGASSPMRERMGNFAGRRRNSTDQPSLTLPRKPSLSSVNGPLASPRDPLPSPRVRIGASSTFDGVLNDSWSSKRRVSDGLMKSGGKGEREVGDQHTSTIGDGIKEEDEEHRTANQPPPPNEDMKDAVQAAPLDQQTTTVHDGIGAAANNAATTASTSNVDERHTNVYAPQLTTSSLDPITTGPPPGLVDLASVEWSYLDPQGQIQGPFRADVMQKWYNDGYFSDDLLMKRAHVGSVWTPVRELLLNAGNAPLFLAPLSGLGSIQRQDPYLGAPPPEQQSTYGFPYQPTPIRNLRSSTLDSYLHNGPTPSGSPSSTFSAARFSNNSPDTSLLGGRIGGHIHSEQSSGAFSSPTVLEPQQRAPSNVPFENVPNGRFGNLAPRPAGSVDGLGFTGTDSATSNGHFNAGYSAGVVETGSPLRTVGSIRITDLMTNGHIGASAYDSSDQGSVAGFSGQQETSGFFSQGLGRGVPDTHPETQPRVGTYVNGNGSSFLANLQPYSQNVSPSFPPQHDTRSLHSLAPERRSSGSTLGVPTLPPQSVQPQYLLSPGQNNSHQAWAPQPQDTAALRRPGPFDPDYPTARNTIVRKTETPPRTYVNGQTPQHTVNNEQSPWFAASQGIVNEGWRGDSNSLTIANLGQHNQQQERESKQQIVDIPASPVPAESTAIPTIYAVPEPAVGPAPPPEPTRPTGKRRKSAAPATTAQPQPTKATPSAVAPVPKPPPSPTSPPTEPKPAWAVDDETKAGSSSHVMTLREIQEAEAKKVEARKAAERERARAAAAAAPVTPAEEIQSFTASWGLPTSQTGSRSNALPKETVPLTSPASVTPSPPVWTNTPKPQVVKKTMKEIQEEEEKRKKLAAKEKETVAAAARRAHIETTNKTTPSAMIGGAWTTVGAGGKLPTAVAVAAPARPVPVNAPFKPTATIVAVASPPAARPVAVTARSTIAVNTTVKLAPAQRMEESPAPAHDFLKWLSDSLKGLNSSVNFEEITSMLLSFPTDPDASTVEIISDLIYANSTTLDGRRFAAEFVSRRKANSKATSPSGTPGKPLSIADVVKTQPKPTQNEWGGFKVVNKKKKGARA